MDKIKSKLPNSGTTIFTVMSRLAQEHNAINISQGYPDFEGPAELRDRVSFHLNHGHNQYAPLAGVQELREQIAAKVLDLYGYACDPEKQIAVTPGATEALYCAITTLVNAGDEVIVFDPAYDTYDPCIRLNGGLVHHIPLNYPEFKIDWDRVRDSVNDKTRLIVINTPHNPSGALWTDQDVECLREIVANTGIYLLTDEVYEHIVFDGREHLSLLRDPELANRTFAVFSFGKTYHATGWRVGYCVAPPPLMEEFLRIHQYINFSTNTPFQYALADFLRDCPEHHHGLGAFYQRKRDLFCELLKPTRFKLIPAHSTFFQLADYSEISNEVDTDFVNRLTSTHKVAAIPVSAFYQSPPDQQVIRFCFAKDDETLMRAAERLRQI
jgi:methionine aminotransferase